MTWHNIWMWYRIVQGSAGVVATIVWFVFLVGSQASINLDGEVIVGTMGTSAILLGNGYGLWVMAAGGFAARKKMLDWQAMLKMVTPIKWRYDGADKADDV